MQTRVRIILGLAAALVLATGAAALGVLAPAPVFPPGNESETFHGVTVPDPYRALENNDDPAVIAWTAAQNDRTHAYLDALPSHAALECDLTRLNGVSASYAYLTASGGRLFALYSDPARQQPILVTLPLSADPAGRRAVVDPAEGDPSGLTTIDWFVPSPDGTKVAVSISRGGTEEGALHIYDVATGREIEAPIPGVQYPTGGGHMAWTGDGKGFWYTRYPGPDAPEAERHFNLQVYFHSLGADAKADLLALGLKDGVERVAEVFLDNRQSLDRVMALVQRGNSDTWAFYVLEPGKPPVRLSTYEDQIVYATLGPDGAAYGISRKGAPNGRVVRAAPPFSDGALAKAPAIVTEGKASIQSGGAENHYPDLSLGKGRLYVRQVLGGPHQLAAYSLTGKPLGALPLPKIAANTEAAVLPDGQVLFDVTTYTAPRYYARWSPKDGKTARTALAETSPVSFDDAEVRQVFATARDGTKIPVTVIMKRGTALDGSHPLLLWGYGSFGINESPFFIGPARRLWLDAGGIYAVAAIRGGAEYGEGWHKAAMLGAKQTTFDDFAAAAGYLISAGYTSPKRLALHGGSAGGLLMGAMVIQHPALIRAVIADAGIYDMIRWRLDPNGVFTEPEYGSVSNPEQFRALRAYSPYHHVEKGVRYPAMLINAGANDNRVSAWQSRKFAAALQSSSASPWPVLLRTSMSAGHGIGSSRDELTAFRADQLAFLFDQLDMTYRSRGACPAA